MADGASPPGDSAIVVTGLVWQQSPPQRAPGGDPAIVGPAIGAGLGAIGAGRSVDLMVSLSRGLTSEQTRFVDRMLATGDLLKRVDRPPLTWFSGPIRGSRTTASFDGDPSAWPAACSPLGLEGHSLVLANGNPRDHLDTLAAQKPARVVLDIDANWSFAHPGALNACIEASALVTVTVQDHARLPRDVTRGTRLGKPGGPALLLKNGADGVILEHAGETRLLPPPSLDGPLGTDVGAGDFLLGFLAGMMAPRVDPLTGDDWAEAYLASLPHLARLLTAASFHAFADMIVETRCGR